MKRAFWNRAIFLTFLSQLIIFGFGSATPASASALTQEQKVAAIMPILMGLLLEEEGSANHVPVISGTPAETVEAGANYSFTPTATYTDNNALVFSISHQPAWANFNTATGQLSGTPGEADIGTSTNTIVISVTDGQSAPVSLPAFDLSVVEPINLAQQFGAASQGANYGNSVAALAIDGDIATFNHTACNATDNWWQVKLPDATAVRQVVIGNRPGQLARLIGAKVYLADTPYNGTLNENDQIGNPLTSETTQTIDLSPAQSGAYLIIKAANGNCLHLTEVEVYGQAATAPQLTQAAYTFLLDWDAANGALVGKITAVDYQLDTLGYSIEGSAPFAVDAQGQLSVSGSIQAGTQYAFKVAVSDGSNTSRVDVTVNITADTALADALQSGDASHITAEELLTAGANLAQTQTDYCKAQLAKIYPAGLQATTFKVRSAYMASSSSRNLPLHVSANAGDPKVYSWLGSKADATRYAVLGTNVFTSDTEFGEVQADLKDSVLNMLRWLLKRDVGDDILSENLTLFVPGSWDRMALNEWFTANGLTHQWTISGDTNLLTSGQFDLYLANIDHSFEEKQQSLALGKPVLVFNNWYEPASKNLALFDLSWRWYGEGSIGDLASVDAQCESAFNGSVISSTLTNLQTGLPDFIYEASDCPNNVGTVQCSLTQVKDAAGQSVEALFNAGASAVRTQLKALDWVGTDVFSLDASYDLLKIAVLLGDKYREQIQYPMDKTSTDDNTFYQALFADFSVHYARSGNAYQPDMGDFTDAQPALNAAATKTATRTFTPTVFGEWTSTGLYAPPGKRITLRRTDAGDSEVKFRVNYLRESTRLWNNNQYSRPRYMSTPVLTLEIGKTYTFSTPYGGPIYLGWMGVESGATPFTVEITNVLDNPLLQAFDSASIQQFLSDVETTASDWVDIKTPYAEIHSLKSYVLKTFDRQDGTEGNGYTLQDVQDYIDDLNNYLIAGNYEYAGFSGAGLDGLNAEVTGFCDTSGFSSIHYDGSVRNLCTDAVIHAKPKIQHVNADVNALCGALCAGNPFDSYAPVDPLGWGENHEMGHNLQRNRLKIYGGRSTEVSNNIFPLHTQWRWTVAQGLDKHPTQRSPANAEAFAILQSAINAGTSAGSSHPLWSGTGIYDNAFQRLSFYMQLAYTQQSWDMYTKMYLMERIFTDAIKADAKWDEVRNLLGFSNYPRKDSDNISGNDATTLNGNDFMYIAASKIAGKNYSNYFAVWGIEVSQMAQDQVVALGITEQVPLLFYYVHDELPAVMPTAADTIQLDGGSSWAEPVH